MVTSGRIEVGKPQRFVLMLVAIVCDGTNLRGENNVFGELLEAGLFVWVVDKYGNKKKVHVKNSEEKRKLLAKNKELRAELKKKGKKPTKKTVKRHIKKEKSLWDYK